MVMGLKNSKILLEENNNLEAYFIFSKDDGELGKYVSKSFNKRILN
jgi:thiamine biosynthesis lipoprotein ApbE